MGRRGREQEPEIEFLSPDRGAFVTGSADGFVDVGGDVDAHFDDAERSRSGWGTLGATAGVLGLLAVTVIAAAPWSSDEAAAPATAPTTTTTTTLSPTTTNVVTIETVSGKPAPGAGYLLGRPPEGFSLAGLYTTGAGPQLGWLELWATPGATRTSGSWFAAHLLEHPPYAVAAGAARVEVGDGRVGLLRRTSDGVGVLTFPLGGNVVATLTGGGDAQPDLVQIGSQMGHIGLRPVFDDATVAGLEQRHAADAPGRSLDEAFVYGRPRAGVLYRADGDAFISVVSSPIDPAAALLAPFVLTQADGFSFSGPSYRISINGLRMTAGLAPGADEVNTVRWETSDEAVALVSNLPLVELLDVAGSVSGASAASWQAAMTQARNVDRPDAVGTTGVTVASGRLAAAGEWKLDVDASGAMATFSTDGSQYVHTFAEDAPLQTFSTPDATVVIARAVAGSGLSLDVTGGNFGFAVPLQPQALVGASFAAVAFDELGGFQASLLDTDGTPLDTITVSE